MGFFKNYIAIFLYVCQLDALSQDWSNYNQDVKDTYSYFSDNYELGRYESAEKHLEWLLDSVPNLNEIIYIKGVKVYSELLSQNDTSKGKSDQYKIKIIDLLDKRLEHFNNYDKVLPVKSRYVMIFCQNLSYEQAKAKINIKRKGVSKVDLLVFAYLLTIKFKVGEISKKLHRRDSKKIRKLLKYKLISDKKESWEITEHFIQDILSPIGHSQE